MTVVMTRWSGTSLGGTHLCDNSRRLFAWGGTCTRGFTDCYRVVSHKAPAYVTLSVYNSLSDSDKVIARARGGCVKDAGYYTYVERTYGISRYVMNPDAVIPFPSTQPTTTLPANMPTDPVTPTLPANMPTNPVTPTDPAPPETIAGDVHGDNPVEVPDKNGAAMYVVIGVVLIAVFLALRR